MATSAFDPELRRAAALLRLYPKAKSPRSLAVRRSLQRRIPVDKSVAIQPVNADVTVRLHRPPPGAATGAAVLWMHGGGMMLGTAAQDDRLCAPLAAELGIVIASVDYRVAPEYPFPTPVQDCQAALEWLAAQPDIDRDRIVVAGVSAGGGLAAALTLAARDRGELSLAGQILIYPMLDDRTVLRAVPGPFRLWDERSNRFAWTSYLGSAPGSAEVAALAAPARAAELAGLPPAWVGVGTRDLFHDESVAYAERLTAAGVACELHVAEGAFHGFDQLCAKTAVARAFTASYEAALSRFLSL